MDEKIEIDRDVIKVPQVAAALGLTAGALLTYMSAKRYAHLRPPGAFKRPGGREWLWERDRFYEWRNSGLRATKRRGAPTKREQLARREAKGSTLQIEGA